MKVKHIVYTALIVGFCSLVIYRIVKGGSSKEKAEMGSGGKPGAAGRPMRVNGIVISYQKFDNSVAITGTIEPNEQVQLRSEMSGVVRGIYFREGSSVRKGQTLVAIDDSELRAQLAQALTRENLARENAGRASLLLKKEAISREESDAAQAELQSLRSQTQLIRAQLAKSVLKAPFNGKIGLRSISVGEYLTPTTVVANLVNTNPVKITFSVPEKYAGAVKVNTTISFTVAGSTQKFKALVYAIEPLIETATRTLQLRARAENADGRLTPGLFANVELPLTTIENAILVPTEAIVPVQEGKKVFVTDSSKAREVMVETSTRTDKEVLITTGLKPGDTVLTTGLMSLKQGTPVKVNTGTKKKK